ncbi:hypothetical protein LJC58_10300, partial [Lachnospiraceae bacterium OttesenSCG-928-D06]|nr:hypothetical protein [Lachnospiraceae bacterium OttesenSCG-928-D06]
TIFFIIFFTIFFSSCLDKSNEYEEMKISDESYLLERDSNEKFFRVEINYPQFQEIKILHLEKVNLLIKDLAFCMLGGETYEDVISNLNEEKENIDISVGAFIDYEILHITENYVSLIFQADIFHGSGPMYTNHYMSTIDLRTGECITFDDILQKEKIIELIQDDNYQLYEGDYNEFGDSHSDVRKEEFINAIEYLLENSDSNSNKYDKNSNRNCGLDDTSLYIYLQFSNSLNGYIILKLFLV